MHSDKNKKRRTRNDRVHLSGAETPTPDTSMKEITESQHMMFGLLMKGRDMFDKNKSSGNKQSNDHHKPATVTVQLGTPEKPAPLNLDMPEILKLDLDKTDEKEPAQPNNEILEEDKEEVVDSAKKEKHQLPMSKHDSKSSANSKKLQKQSESEVIGDILECEYCKVRSPARYTKFEKSISDLVCDTIKSEMPSLLSETIKEHIAVKIVKQTKQELSSINESNYKRIEKSAINYAENKIKESKSVIEEKIQTKIDKMVADEINNTFKTVVLPK